ncbi:MAG: DHA2 family efflux MFS transporter permease subunit [candidate division NC10 bacterium]|nr:DHA2 family efflux MFS transporter permease subunit [candidate division NC10 bacterium]
MMRENPSAEASYKWWVTVTTMMGALMVVLDITIVNVAIPNIMASFGVNVETIEWVVTAYMMAMSVMMPTVGWLGDALGNKNLYAASLTLFTAGSALCGMAWNNDSLVLFRILQGIGAGVLLPVSMAIMYEAFPVEQRGFAMGLYGVGVTIGPAIGPALGGYLTERLTWRWVFYVNLPFGVLGVLLATLVLRQLRPREVRPFDFLGFLTMSGFLVSLLLALSKGQREGWDSDYILSVLGISLLFLISFLIIEGKVKNPLIELGLFRNPVFSAITALAMVFGVGLFGSTFLIPLFTQHLMGYTPIQTGIVMLPGALAVAVFLPLSGRLTDRLDPRFPLTLGIALFTASLYWMSLLDLRTSYAAVMGMLVLRGVGMGFIFPPLLNTALGAVPPAKVGLASGLLNVLRQLGGSFGIALLSTLLVRREAFHRAIYAEGIVPGSYGAREAIQALEALAAKSGGSIVEVKARAMALLQSLVVRRAQVSAYDDAFLLTAVLTLLSMVLIYFVRRFK